jgi:hypothetical protein
VKSPFKVNVNQLETRNDYFTRAKNISSNQTNENIHAHRLQHAMLTHYPEVDQMSKSTKNEPKKIIQLINQINTWHKFDGP